MARHWPIGTLINVVAVVIGSTIGLLLRDTFPQGVKEIVFQAIGLATIFIGLKMLLRLPEGYVLVFIFSLIVGGIVGELAGLDTLIRQASDSLKNALSISEAGFTEGLITAFILFCIGSMTLVGSLEEGLTGNRQLLLTKSLLDGFSSVALAASLGIGVLFSVLPMIIVQGGITLSARWLRPYANDTLINSMSAVGGALIMGIAIVLLELGELRLNNLLPALIVVIIFSAAVQKAGWLPAEVANPSKE